jgi:hypothetical protein
MPSIPNSSLAWSVFICMRTAPSVALSAPNDDVPDRVSSTRPPGTMTAYASPITNPCFAAASTSMVNSPRSGGAPSTSVKALSSSSSIQLNASCGGPSVAMLPPSALIGRTAFSAASMLGTAEATPSTAATTDTVSAERGGVSPKSAWLRTSRSTPAVMSLDTSRKLLRRPSARTNADTTKLTARITPEVVRAKRTLFARMLLKVSRYMTRFQSVCRCPLTNQLPSRRMWSKTASGVGSASSSVMRPSARKTTRCE